MAGSVQKHRGTSFIHNCWSVLKGGKKLKAAPFICTCVDLFLVFFLSMKLVCGFEEEACVCVCVKYLFEIPQGWPRDKRMPVSGGDDGCLWRAETSPSAQPLLGTCWVTSHRPPEGEAPELSRDAIAGILLPSCGWFWTGGRAETLTAGWARRNLRNVTHHPAAEWSTDVP